MTDPLRELAAREAGADMHWSDGLTKEQAGQAEGLRQLFQIATGKEWTITRPEPKVPKNSTFAESAKKQHKGDDDDQHP